MTVTIVGQEASVKKRITCRHCGGINEYVPNDVKELYKGKDIDGGISVTKGFLCGQCNRDVITESY